MAIMQLMDNALHGSCCSSSSGAVMYAIMCDSNRTWMAAGYVQHSVHDFNPLVADLACVYMYRSYTASFRHTKQVPCLLACICNAAQVSTVPFGLGSDVMGGCGVS